MEDAHGGVVVALGRLLTLFISGHAAAKAIHGLAAAAVALLLLLLGRIGPQAGGRALLACWRALLLLLLLSLRYDVAHHREVEKGGRSRRRRLRRLRVSAVIRLEFIECYLFVFTYSFHYWSFTEDSYSHSLCQDDAL